MNLIDVPYHNLFEEFIRRAAENARKGEPIEKTIYEFEDNFKALSRKVRER
jgi:hypothetical protein